MEEVSVVTQLDKLISRVEALTSQNDPPSLFKVTRTFRTTRYNLEYCVNIYHNDLLVLRRCESIRQDDASTSTIQGVWDRLDEEAVIEFMMYAIFGKQNMIEETVSLRKSKKDATKSR